MLSEFEKTILRANQLVLRDRFWNHSEMRAKAKITDENITELLNPKHLQESESLKAEQAKEIEVPKETGLKLSDEQWAKEVAYAKRHTKDAKTELGVEDKS